MEEIDKLKHDYNLLIEEKEKLQHQHLDKTFETSVDHNTIQESSAHEVEIEKLK